MQGRHVVVTGGRGALGKGVVELLTSHGAIVHVADRPEAQLDNEAGAIAYFAALPPIWASIHLVGGFAMTKIADTSLADFEAQWRVNAVTCFLSCREAIKSIRAGGTGGRIVNVAARTVVSPVGGMTSYIAGKAAVAAMTQGLAAEVLAENILVNAVLPSVIDTPANRSAMPKADHATWPRPAEIAQTIAYLVSPENTLTSGALVPVYGRG